MNASSPARWIDPRCTPLPFTLTGPFLVLGDGTLLVVEDNATRVSQDDGRTWSPPRPMVERPPEGVPDGSCVLVRTRGGVLVVVYMDMSTFRWGWDSERKCPQPDVRLDVWSIRSLDEGRTWIDRQKILEGYCGALISMLETRSGRIVVPVQDLLRLDARHGVYTYVSDDAGHSWQRSNLIDLGGRGHHDGALEPTLAQRRDGRLWMLIRTNLDWFWDAFSEDEGLSWRVIRPSNLDASSAPGCLLRLCSGRLVLVWNRLCPEGETTPARRGGDDNLSRPAASWCREELSIAFSSEDETWTRPVVMARQKGVQLSYPALLERRPGEIWVTTRFHPPAGNPPLCVSLKEKDFTG